MLSSFELLENTSSGTCIVIGNGPSLREVPRAFLTQYPTFGSNGIFLLDGFEPTYYVAVNPLVIEQFHAQIKQLQSTKFITRGMGFPETYELTSMHTPLFSYNPAAYIYEGHTVTFVALQIAFFMGYETVYLVGVDHKYVFWGAPDQETLLEGDDINHFHPNYFKGLKWNNPNLVASEHSYRLARKAFEGVDRRIINLTPNTEENVFERGSL